LTYITCVLCKYVKSNDISRYIDEVVYRNLGISVNAYISLYSNYYDLIKSHSNTPFIIQSNINLGIINDMIREYNNKIGKNNFPVLNSFTTQLMTVVN
jgi:hypothetical protein